MCLKIDSTVKARKPDKDGYCVAWKVITIDNRPVMYPRNFEYRVGENCMNKESLTEKKWIHFVLHLFLTKKVASSYVFFRKQYDEIQNKIIKTNYHKKEIHRINSKKLEKKPSL